MNKMSKKEYALSEIIKDILWMARRYAHNRSSYAPWLINTRIDQALKLGIEIEKDTVDGIEMYADDGMLGKWNPEKRRFEKEL